MGTPSGEIRAGLFVFLYIGRQHGSGQHSDEDAKCGRKSGDDSKRGRNLHWHVYLTQSCRPSTGIVSLRLWSLPFARNKDEA